MENYNSMRTKKSIYNILFSVGGQFVGIITAFIVRIFFLRVLSAEYLGINGLFTNVLAILSLVELGVGPAMSFSLYKPLAESNVSLIKSLMRFYKRAYVLIGIVVLFLGVLFLPFYRVLINNPPHIPYLNVIYLLFIINSGVSYFYAYKRSIIICDQKQYIITIFDCVFKILLNGAQILFLITTHNYIVFLGCQIVSTLAENILISKIANKSYPYLLEKEVNKLPSEVFLDIKHNISAMMLHQVGGVVVSATDNIVISRMCGLVWVGLYSNYSMVIQNLTAFITQLFNSIIASVGNLGATESPKKMLLVFNRLFFIDFWIFGFSSITLVVLLNPFIELWLGRRYLFSIPVVLSFVAVYYILGMRQAVLTFTNATGVFWYSRYKPIFEALINLGCSIFLAHYLGIAGVFVGTIIGSLTTSFWVDPYVLYKYVFRKSMARFFIRYAYYTVVMLIVGGGTWFVCGIITVVSWPVLFLKLLICVIMVNSLFLLVFFKTEECRFSFDLFKQLFQKYSHKLTKCS